MDIIVLDDRHDLSYCQDEKGGGWYITRFPDSDHPDAISQRFLTSEDAKKAYEQSEIVWESLSKCKKSTELEKKFKADFKTIYNA